MTTHACLDSNIMTIPEQLTGTASSVKEVSGGSPSVIGSMHYINKSILCPRSNDIDRINEEVHNSLVREVNPSGCGLLGCDPEDGGSMVHQNVVIIPHHYGV
jgi:hypothetical protein